MADETLDASGLYGSRAAAGNTVTKTALTPEQISKLTKYSPEWLQAMYDYNEEQTLADADAQAARRGMFTSGQSALDATKALQSLRMGLQNEAATAEYNAAETEKERQFQQSENEKNRELQRSLAPTLLDNLLTTGLTLGGQYLMYDYLGKKNKMAAMPASGSVSPVATAAEVASPASTGLSASQPAINSPVATGSPMINTKGGFGGGGWKGGLAGLAGGITGNELAKNARGAGADIGGAAGGTLGFALSGNPLAALALTAAGTFGGRHAGEYAQNIGKKKVGRDMLNAMSLGGLGYLGKQLSGSWLGDRLGL